MKHLFLTVFLVAATFVSGALAQEHNQSATMSGADNTKTAMTLCGRTAEWPAANGYTEEYTTKGGEIIDSISLCDKSTKERAEDSGHNHTFAANVKLLLKPAPAGQSRREYVIVKGVDEQGNPAPPCINDGVAKIFVTVARRSQGDDLVVTKTATAPSTANATAKAEVIIHQDTPRQQQTTTPDQTGPFDGHTKACPPNVGLILCGKAISEEARGWVNLIYRNRRYRYNNGGWRDYGTYRPTYGGGYGNRRGGSYGGGNRNDNRNDNSQVVIVNTGGRGSRRGGGVYQPPVSTPTKTPPNGGGIGGRGTGDRGIVISPSFQAGNSLVRRDDGRTYFSIKKRN